MELAYVFSIALNILFFVRRQIRGSIPQVQYSSLSRCLSCSKGCLSASTGASSTFQCPTATLFCSHFCRRESPLTRLSWACFCFQDHLSSLSSSRVIASILSWLVHLVQIHSFRTRLLLSSSSHQLSANRSTEFRLSSSWVGNHRSLRLLSLPPLEWIILLRFQMNWNFISGTG